MKLVRTFAKLGTLAGFLFWLGFRFLVYLNWSPTLVNAFIPHRWFLLLASLGIGFLIGFLVGHAVNAIKKSC